MRVLVDRVLEPLWRMLLRWRIGQLRRIASSYAQHADHPHYDTVGHRNFMNEALRYAGELERDLNGEI